MHGARTVIAITHQLASVRNCDHLYVFVCGRVIEEGTRQTIDILVAPQCTSPVREPVDFDAAIALFEREGHDSLFSATPVDDFNIWRPNAEGELESFTYDYRNRERRQDKAKQFLENGSFWVLNPSILRRHNNRLGPKSR